MHITINYYSQWLELSNSVIESHIHSSNTSHLINSWVQNKKYTNYPDKVPGIHSNEGCFT